MEGMHPIDCSDTPAQPLALWPAVRISGEDIEAEIERLASLPAPENGRRSSLIVHPNASPASRGLAPGIRVSLSVLKPGEQTQPIRHNSTHIDFCIQGTGSAMVAGQSIAFGQYDVWNTPSMTPYWYSNHGDELQARLTYSNAALLEMMNVHVVDENPPVQETSASAEPQEETQQKKVQQNVFDTFQLSPEGPHLMPYERLINPPVVASQPWHWPWKNVKQELDKLVALGKDYVGRRLYLLYNPATGRTNGTTQNFFATITIRPPQHHRPPTPSYLSRHQLLLCWTRAKYRRRQNL